MMMSGTMIHDDDRVIEDWCMKMLYICMQLFHYNILLIIVISIIIM